MYDIKKLAGECLSCVNKTCIKGCPLDNDITEFIRCIKVEKYKEAFDELSNTTILMSVCGRVCPHFKQCEKSCIKFRMKNPVEIGKLESMIGDMALDNNWKINVPNKTKYNVAVVGSGPAGLTCAYFLRKKCIGVTIYEKYDYLGGLLVHGIPDFRLDKTLVKNLTNSIIDLGINVKYNTSLGADISLDELKEKHAAVFIAVGANKSNKLNIIGEDLNGVYGANEVLEYDMQMDYNNKDIVIIGGGNVAVDMARTCKRKGAENVTVIYRRSKNEMTADDKEISEAIKEGVKFLYQNNVVKIIGNKKVEQVELIKTELINNKEDRKIPVNIDGSNYNINCDIIIKAIGSHTEDFVQKLKINKQSNGKIKITENGNTSDEKVFAGGDVAGTQSTVSWAAKAGRNAAYEIIKYLKKQKEFLN